MTRALLACVMLAAACSERPSSALSPPCTTGITDNGVHVSVLSKLDLLLVVDNSAGMSGAQAKLATALPALLDAATQPTVDAWTGSQRRIRDVHVGVISTSLGSYGTSACAPSIVGAQANDRAHLLACHRTGAPSALSWVFDPTKDAQHKGPTELPLLADDASCVVRSAGDEGCGYEATWESVYRFLADPKPYAGASVACTFGPSGDECGSNKIEVAGVDDELHAERAAFLRPDSVLAVVVLSNENDASLKPAGLNWIPWAYGAGKMLPGWTGCANVPDDFEPESPADFTTLHTMYGCKSCFEDASDARCSLPWDDRDPDARNLRAFEQTRRFGYNFLYGRQRYVNAWKSPQALASDGSLSPNPVFLGGFRTSDLVLVTAIVGVPPSLVADDTGAPKSLDEEGWTKIIGPVGARDPHMIESIAPRPGLPRFVGDRAVDPVHGGERDLSMGDDLQYACIGKRSPTAPSAPCRIASDPTCELWFQAYDEAYPGLRHARIVHDLGASGMLASICSDDYTPTMRALGERIRAKVQGCPRTDVQLRADGSAQCEVYEVFDAWAPSAHCEDLARDQALCTPGRTPCSAESIAPEDLARDLLLHIDVTRDGSIVTRERLETLVEGGDIVGVDSTGRKHLVCQALQLVGRSESIVPATVANACLHDPLPTSSLGGWCYTTDPALLSKGCELGTLRFLGGAQPREGVQAVPVCWRGEAPGCY